MQITDVRLRKVNSENRMKAVASVTFDNEFAVHDIKVIESQNGLFIAMPSRKTPNGEFKDIAHPINAETREKIQKAILEAYEAPEAEEASEESAEIKKIRESDFNERDLHPLLVKYVKDNPHFHCYAKTIYQENSVRKVKGANEWLHPDLVGVYFPFGDYSKETMKLQVSLNINSIKLFSFEMKKHLDYGNLRQCFFQAVSNSSWANEGYLVCLKLNNEPDFLNEIQRLSNAFGIGIIQLNVENINDSEIVCPARYNESSNRAVLLLLYSHCFETDKRRGDCVVKRRRRVSECVIARWRSRGISG